jgi:1,4-alpha-glucan branching enzyme
MHPDGFRWVDCSDEQSSVLSILRTGGSGNEPVLVVLNFTPVVRQEYRVGVPLVGVWKEVLNSDAAEYGGSGEGNLGLVETENLPHNGMEQSVSLLLPSMSALFLRHQES